MRGENESVQNNLTLEKVMGIMDSFKMLCVVLILVFPEDRVFFVCSFVLLMKTRKIFVHNNRIIGRIKERNIRVLLSIP